MPRSVENYSHSLSPLARKQCDAVQMAFGLRVRQVRKEAGLTIEDLAERSSLHPSYVGGVERGTRNLSLFNIWRLASGLNVTADELVRTLPKPPRNTHRERSKHSA